MNHTMARRALRPAERDRRVIKIGLAMCNAERKHHMLFEIRNWDDVTDEAQAHYRRLAEAALAAITN